MKSFFISNHSLKPGFVTFDLLNTLDYAEYLCLCFLSPLFLERKKTSILITTFFCNRLSTTTCWKIWQSLGCGMMRWKTSSSHKEDPSRWDLHLLHYPSSLKLSFANILFTETKLALLSCFSINALFLHLMLSCTYMVASCGISS